MSSTFVVAATIALAISGHSVQPYDGNVKYDIAHRFETRAGCEEHRNSDHFKLEQQELVAMIIRPFKEPLPDVTITTACHEFTPDAEGKLHDLDAGEKP